MGNSNRNNRGFTLIEIMVVVVIIGLLATLVGPRVWAMLFAGQQQIALTKCKGYYDDAHTWKMYHKKFPADLEEMTGPLTKNDKNPFIRVEDDPWGNPYWLDNESGSIRVSCAGPDGIEGSEDDISYPELDE